MPASVSWSGGRLLYTGRVARAPFKMWTDTKVGRATVAAAASRIGFSLFPKERKARRRLWRQLVAAARDVAVVAAMEREVRAYLERLGELAYAEGLPRVGVSLHRLVVVPRVLLNAAAYRSIETTLSAQPAFASLAGGEPLRSLFFQQLVEEMDLSVAKARPSPNRTLPAGADWASVGLNAAFVWRLPVLDWVSWNGHHYVLELTREPITRAVRNEVAASIEQLEASLPSLSRLERNEILRRASVWRSPAARTLHAGPLSVSTQDSRSSIRQRQSSSVM